MNKSTSTICRLIVLLLVVILVACSGRDQSQDARENQVSVFTEVADRVGLDFQHFIGATGEYYFPEIMGAGIALLDFDNDGDLDVYALQGDMLETNKSYPDALFAPPDRHWPGNRLFRNELNQSGILEFTDVTDAAGIGDIGYGMGIAVGDIDNDGDPDLYVTNYGPNVLYRNNGNGTFTDITESSGTDDPRWSTSAAFLDYDRDQDLDLIVTNYVSFVGTNHKLCYGRGRVRDYCEPAAYLPLTDRLFRNDGGHFTDVTATSGLDTAFGPGLGVTVADFNNDGWPDIYVVNDMRANQLWMNDGEGSFRDIALISGSAYNAHGAAEAGMGVTADDIDNDGDDDLFVTHLNGQTNTLYTNLGGDSFLDATDQWNLGLSSLPFTGFGTAWFDYDNDRTLDLYIANGAVSQVARGARDRFLGLPSERPLQRVPTGVRRLLVRARLQMARPDPDPYAQTNQLVRFDGHGSAQNVSEEAGPAMQLNEVSRGAAFDDIDNDGDIDIVVSNNNGPLRLMRNEIGTQGNWLRVRLTGTRSPHDGTGARVVLLHMGEPVLWRRAHTDGSYLSASDIRLHIGLGELDDEIQIGVVWTSGIRELWPVSEVNREISLTEGTGQSWAAE